ncbi:hypothetical protein D187_004140 [Cystobacter fuscus DSM 2262]|uniref:Transcription factor zinc-finger domain-containing protein n=2 Tax=Cystobacter fuscus TaxID=43 RepID=S9QAM2_CYSF2|nr:hypothetical protein D187_004140 [Cystobacter fuscus DSM 2262]
MPGMARPCPLCANEQLRPLRVSHVEVGTCAHCHGLWFGRGAWARVPDRPPMRAFLGAARRAPSRCRKRGHLIPPERGTCATCGGAPLACPDCGRRLARVVTRASPVEVCPHCEGLWLDAGGYARLEGVTDLQAAPASVGKTSIQTCSACADTIQADMFVHEGDVYCSRCRPPGAVPRRR